MAAGGQRHQAGVTSMHPPLCDSKGFQSSGASTRKIDFASPSVSNMGTLLKAFLWSQRHAAASTARMYSSIYRWRAFIQLCGIPRKFYELGVFFALLYPI